MKLKKEELHLDHGEIQNIKGTVRFSLALTDFLIAMVMFLGAFIFSLTVILPAIPTYSENVTWATNEQLYAGIKYYDKQFNVIVEIGEEHYFDRVEDDYLPRRSKYLFVNTIAYYYLSYMTGNEVVEGFNYCAYANDTQVLVDNVTAKPSEHYTVSWFNEYILKINESNSYFELIDSDPSKVATIKAEFLDDKGDVKSDYLYAFIQNVYKVMAQNYGSFENVKQHDAVINKYRQVAKMISGFVVILICYLIVPLFTKYGKTFAMLLDKVGTIKPNGELIKKWQLIPRMIPFLLLWGISVMFPLINASLYILEFIFIPIYAIICFVIYRREYRMPHDYLSNTFLTYVRKEPKIDLEKIVADAEEKESNDD